MRIVDQSGTEHGAGAMIGWRTTPSTQGKDKHAGGDSPRGFDGFELRLGDQMRGERATLSKSLLDVQRELKIKASYIAAIENADLGAFETPGFIAGYVRSYARYLGMDPEQCFARFCVESGFVPAHGLAPAASGPKPVAVQKKKKKVENGDPLANPHALFVPRGRSAFTHVAPGAVGSVLVLAALVAGIGYGGWTVLQEVQKVRLAPVDQAPGVVAELDPLDAAVNQPTQTASADDHGVSLPGADALDRLYRPETLDVPVLVARDGPIAAIDPRSVGALASLSPSLPGQPDATQVAALPEGMQGPMQPQAAAPGGINAALAEAMGGDQPVVQTLAATGPGVSIVAVRPSWVRVSAADGTVLFEKILDAGEHYKVPQMEQPPVLRAGNSGSVYFAVNGQTYGPAAPGAQVVKNVKLSPEALTGAYKVADVKQDPELAKAVALAQAQIAGPRAD